MQRSIRHIMLFISVCFLILTIARSLRYVENHWGCDLRIRIVGARVMATEQSPYFYKWKPQDGDYYYDPTGTILETANGNVATPAVLNIIYPLSLLSYSKIRLIWALLEILFCFGAIILILKQATMTNKIFSFCTIVLGIICTDIWVMEIERGQMYLFYTFLFALMYRAYMSKWKYNEFVSGLIGGFFILFRPFAIIIGLPFLLKLKLKWIAGCAVGFAMACLLFVLPRPLVWNEYYKAMKEYSRINISGEGNSLEPVMPTHTVEGIHDQPLYIAFDIRSMNTVNQYLMKLGVTISSNQAIVLYMIAVALLALFFFRIDHVFDDSNRVFLFSFLLFFLAEIFATAPRAPYNIVQWIFPVGLICAGGKMKNEFIALLFVGLLFLHYFPYRFPFQVEIAELIFVVITFLCVYFPKVVNRKAEDNISV